MHKRDGSKEHFSKSQFLFIGLWYIYWIANKDCQIMQRAYKFRIWYLHWDGQKR